MTPKALTPVFFYFFLLSLFLPHKSIAQIKGHGVEARLVSAKLVETAPGKIVTVSFLITNKTEKQELFFEELNLPEGWRPIVPVDQPFILAPEEQHVRIIAFSVPFTARAGGHAATYTVRSQRDYAITDTDTFEVVVLPVVKLQMMVEDKPEAVIAGEVYNAKVRLINRGNSKITLTLEIKGIPDYPVSSESTIISLEAGESRLIHFKVQTDEKIKAKITHVIRIKAISDKPLNGAALIERTFTALILPKVTGEFEPYHNLPAYLKFTGAFHENNESGSGFQMEFGGSGTLKEKGTDRIDFLFKGPDTQDRGIYGARDEYRFSYYNELFDVHLGDRSYSLSPLTERYRYGRGAEANIHFNGFGAGVFHLESRWDKPELNETGAHVKYKFSDFFSVQGNFLNRNRDSYSLLPEARDKIYSIQTNIKYREMADLDMEYGFGRSRRDKTFSDNAYRVALRGQLPKKIWYHFEKIHAGPEYFGYYNNSDHTSGSVIVPITKDLRWNASFKRLKDNLDLDPAVKSSSNREESYRTGFTYHLPTKTTISLEYEDFQREDRLFPVDYDFKEKVLILGLGQSFNRIGFHAYMESGKSENMLTNHGTNKIERYSIFAYLYPTSKLTFSFYARIGHNRYTDTLERSKSAGGSATWRPLNALSMNINYNRNDFDTENKRHQDNITSDIRYTLPNKHLLQFKGNWIKTRGFDRESSFSISYTIPLKIPVSKKLSIGIIRGRIYDAENGGKPVPNIILSAGNATAVTNQSGEFIFPALKPGAYLIKVDKGSIGLNRVTNVKLPITAEVRGGETTEIDIGVTTACRIYGQVLLYDFINQDVNRLVESGGLSNAVIQISNGSEVIRKATDKNGRFSFEDVRPGKWTVSVYNGSLPARHYLETEQVQIELSPGENKEIVFKFLPRIRRIKIIEEASL